MGGQQESTGGVLAQQEPEVRVHKRGVYATLVGNHCYMHAESHMPQQVPQEAPVRGTVRLNQEEASGDEEKEDTWTWLDAGAALA